MSWTLGLWSGETSVRSEVCESLGSMFWECQWPTWWENKFIDRSFLSYCSVSSLHESHIKRYDELNLEHLSGSHCRLITNQHIWNDRFVDGWQDSVGRGSWNSWFDELRQWYWLLRIGLRMLKLQICLWRGAMRTWITRQHNSQQDQLFFGYSQFRKLPRQPASDVMLQTFRNVMRSVG